MPKFTVQFRRELLVANITVNCEYYRLEDGWFTFKDATHKDLLGVPAAQVIVIKRAE